MKGRGHFFAVDLPTFETVCQADNADAAAAYLVLAAGTRADNRITSWSREAINKRTALNWARADAAIAFLEAHHLLTWQSGKGTRRPRIELPPIYGPGRDVVWLPMSLVGDEGGNPVPGQTCIVERIRKSRDAMAFHLLARFAFHQDLPGHGGIPRVHLQALFERGESHRAKTFDLCTFEQGSLMVYGTPATLPHRQEGKDHYRHLWARIRILEDAGAIEWAFHVAEDAQLDSILMYPVALVRHGALVPDIETLVGQYATAAAVALSSRSSTELDDWRNAAPDQFFVPVDSMNRKAAMVGVPRLRGRARTRMTAAWQAERFAAAEEWIATFRGIIAQHAPELLEELDRKKADFNEDFNATSTLSQRDLNDSGKSPMYDRGGSGFSDDDSPCEKRRRSV